MSVFDDFFSQRTYGKQYLNLFNKMAYSITCDYVDQTMTYIEDNGFAPSFEEIMGNVKKLKNELEIKGAWLRDDYKKERGKRSPRLTKGFKRIVNGAINDYVKRTKTLTLIKRSNTTFYTFILSMIILTRSIGMDINYAYLL